MESAQDHVQWWALVLVMLSVWILIPQCSLVNKNHIKHEIRMS
jgi:hypothetical protein